MRGKFNRLTEAIKIDIFIKDKNSALRKLYSEGYVNTHRKQGFP